MLYVGTHGRDDPTRATLPFHMAIGALDAGFTAQVLLVGDGTYTLKDKVAAEIRGVATPPLTEALQKVVVGGGELLV
jgi:predicted peroxiredoxin